MTLETRIRWRPYPEQRPEPKNDVTFQCLTDRGLIVWRRYYFAKKRGGYFPVKDGIVTHFALPEDITTEETKGGGDAD